MFASLLRDGVVGAKHAARHLRTRAQNFLRNTTCDVPARRRSALVNVQEGVSHCRMARTVGVCTHAMPATAQNPIDHSCRFSMFHAAVYCAA